MPDRTIVEGVSPEALELFPKLPDERPKSRYRFSGHQTFPFRYTWLPKAIQGMAQEKQLFFGERAMLDLGVGKNMVASIRHWCEAMELATFDTRSNSSSATSLGSRVFSRRGWDPYLENPGTLWLLHWLLVELPERATTWHLTFTRWYKDTFTREELAEWISQFASQASNVRATRVTVTRDVDTFLRTYVAAPSTGRRVVEDTFDCPLAELGLVRRVDGEMFQLVRGPKPTLPVEVFAFALANYWQRAGAHQETLQFERILYGPGSPGSAFKLSEQSLVQLLEQMPVWAGLRYDETAGARVVIRHRRNRRMDSLSILERYYTRASESFE